MKRRNWIRKGTALVLCLCLLMGTPFFSAYAGTDAGDAGVQTGQVLQEKHTLSDFFGALFGGAAAAERGDQAGSAAGADAAEAEAAQGTGNLTLTNTVPDVDGADQAWHFTVKLSDASVSGAYGDLTFEDGVAPAAVRPGDTVCADGLPAGVRYTVAAESAGGYMTVGVNAEGRIPDGGTASAEFISHIPGAEAALEAADALLPEPAGMPVLAVPMASSTTTTLEILYQVDEEFISNFSCNTHTPELQRLNITLSVSGMGAGQHSYSVENGGDTAGTSVTGDSGRISLTLEPNQLCTITGLPSGAKCRIENPFDQNCAIQHFWDNFNNPSDSTEEVTLAEGDPKQLVGTMEGQELTFDVTPKEPQYAKEGDVLDFAVMIENPGESSVQGVKLKISAGEGLEVAEATNGEMPVDLDSLTGNDGADIGEIKTEGKRVTFKVKVNSAAAAAAIAAGGPSSIDVSIRYDENPKNTFGFGAGNPGSGMDPVDTYAEEPITIPIYIGDYGNLSVSKTVQGTEGDTTRDFHFRVQLSGDGADAVQGAFGAMTFDAGSADVTLKHGETKTAEGLPAGLSYTVTETEANQDGYATTSTGATGTIPKGDTAQAAFVNTKPRPETPPPNPGDPGGDPSDLTVTKTVTGSAGDRSKAFRFRVELSDPSIQGQHGGMDFTDGVAEFSLRHGESRSASNLPDGVTYTVTEAEANLDGYTTTSEGASGTIGGGVSRADFINQKGTTPENPPDTPENPPDTPPDEPNQPEENPPSEPGQPADEPSVPSEPATTGTPGQPGTPADDAPQTGDDSPVGFYLILLALSAAGLVWIGHSRKEQN